MEEKEVPQEGEGEATESGSDPDAGDETGSDDKGEEYVAAGEEERVEMSSVVETAAPTDAVKSDNDPTIHHPLVRYFATVVAQYLVCMY